MILLGLKVLGRGTKVVGFHVRVVSRLKGLEGVSRWKGGIEGCGSLLPLCHERRQQSTLLLW